MNMYKFLGLFTGVIIAIMVSINGVLTIQFGIFTAAIIIHIVGILFSFVLLKSTGKSLCIKNNLIPIWLYLGGMIGVLTTVFNNFAFGKISMTSIIALGLFGQSLFAILIDCFGFLGMEKIPFRFSSLVGLIFSSIGIIIMLDHSIGLAIYAVFLSIFAGITVVLSRTVNAKLAKYTGELQSSFINHVMGLPVTILFFFILGKNELLSLIYISNLSWDRIYIFFGGILGVITVLFCNITVPKISAFQLTLLTFIGQIFTGILIDIFFKSNYARETFYGGLLISLGIIINLLIDRTYNKNNKKKKEA